MKKGFFLTVLTAVLLSLPIAAEESSSSNTSPYSYENIPIYQVQDGPDFYLVIYAKYGAGAGKVTIPKSWAKADKDTAAKLKFRQLPGNMNPYMTVIKKDGSFYKVYITVSLNRSNSVWGKVPNGAKADDANKTTLEDIQL